MSLLLDATWTVGGTAGYTRPLSLVERLAAGQYLAVPLPAAARVQLALRAHVRHSRVVAFVGTPNGDAFTVEQILYREQADGLFHYLDLFATSSAPGTQRIVIAGVNEAEFDAFEVGAQFSTMHGAVMDVLVPPNRGHLHAETDFDVFMQLLLGQNPGEDSALINADNIDFGTPVDSEGDLRNTDVVLTAREDGELREGSRTVSYNRITIEDLITDLGGEIDDLGDEDMTATTFARAISALTGVRMRADAIVVEQLAEPVEGVLTRLATIQAASDHPVWVGEATVTLRAYPEVPDVPPLADLLRVTALDGFVYPIIPDLGLGDNVALWFPHAMMGSYGNDQSVWAIPSNGRLAQTQTGMQVKWDIGGSYHPSANMQQMDTAVNVYEFGQHITGGQSYLNFDVSFEPNVDGISNDRPSTPYYLHVRYLDEQYNRVLIETIELFRGDGDGGFTALQGKRTVNFVFPNNVAFGRVPFGLSVGVSNSADPDGWESMPDGAHTFGTVVLDNLGLPPPAFTGEVADVVARERNGNYVWNWRESTLYVPTVYTYPTEMVAYTPEEFGADFTGAIAAEGDNGEGEAVPNFKYLGDGHWSTEGSVQLHALNTTYFRVTMSGGNTVTIPDGNPLFPDFYEPAPGFDGGMFLGAMGHLTMATGAPNRLNASVGYGLISGQRGSNGVPQASGVGQRADFTFTRDDWVYLDFPNPRYGYEPGHSVELTMSSWGGTNVSQVVDFDVTLRILCPPTAKIDALLKNVEIFTVDEWMEAQPQESFYSLPERGAGQSISDVPIYGSNYSDKQLWAPGGDWSSVFPENISPWDGWVMRGDLVRITDTETVVAKVVYVGNFSGGG